ncbi:hypothetical protein ALC60_04597 [Trachymyrmex zeteki]|uniref:Uncharacterized protein n=1 Tax=Mycetomoellerius zeteki TaxID=64791 RepID=A0A151X880_9HYME|nr:hypothetical protein ALC60_04597 [Trachymyrmex zeteki]
MYMKLIRQSSCLTFGDRITFSAVSGLCRDLGQTSSCYKEWVGKNPETSECWPSPLSNRAENSSVTSHTTPPQCQQAWKDFVRLLGGPEASSHHCLIYFVKQSCRQFNGPNYIKLGTA